MPAVAVQGQDLHQVGNHVYCFTRFIYNASGETVVIPVGSISGACLATNSTNVSPTVSIAQGATNDTVTLTGGTAPSGCVLVTRHTGGVISR